MARPIKILAIDGGGMRGIIPAVILAEIERRARKPTAQLFDLVAGSSTGGLLALGIVKPGRDGLPASTAAEGLKLYEIEGPHVFTRSVFHRMRALGNVVGGKYPNSGIEDVLERYFGDTRLADATTDVLITSYEIQERLPWVFQSRKARHSSDHDYPMKAVARATTAAPTYFEPALVTNGDPENPHALIDGSFLANNPALYAFIEARGLYPSHDDFLVVSLGTGDQTRPLDYAVAKNWGKFGWAQPALDVVFHAMSKTIDNHIRRLLPAVQDGRQNYYRFQTRLDGASDDMDDASQENIAALKRLGRKLVAENDETLDQLCAQLLA